MTTNLIKRTHEWFVTSGQMPPVPKPDIRQSAFYLGMQLEELAEKLLALHGGVHTPLIINLTREADELKEGQHDHRMQWALSVPAAAAELLDADMDLVWVSVGAAYAGGADAAGAYNEVARANWDKFPGGVVSRDPATGKVLKPEGWRGPDLTPFLATGEEV